MNEGLSKEEEIIGRKCAHHKERRKMDKSHSAEVIRKRKKILSKFSNHN